MPTIKIQFLGAAGTVTGSKFYLETPEKNIMVDCGMFQGIKELRQRNWDPLPIVPQNLDAVFLTHGHLDHTGYLPRLFKAGFRGPVYGTAPTLDIAEIILSDSAKIHEEEAQMANAEGYSKHDPALPFYSLSEAEFAIKFFNPKERDTWYSLSENIKYRFRYNGHIIGATFIEMDIYGKRFVFSGDVGKQHDALLAPPEQPEWADYLFMESTYGDKDHPEEDVETLLADLVNRTIHQKGNLIIPSFAVERLQSLMYLLWHMYRKNKIPNIPIYVDSPMGNDVLSVFERHPQWHQLAHNEYRAMCGHMNIIQSYRETWETIDDPRPKIIIAGSGMVTGGRVLTYLQQLVDRPTTTILLVGYMAEGTRGRKLLEGTEELKIYGKHHSVKASVVHFESLSAHADQQELMNWLGKLRNIPENTFLIHGEPDVLQKFQNKLMDVFGWHITIPQLNQIFTLVL
ncbi:MBL fold metallo-hydrolase RNA specificity domain-containing protein [Flagellimonas meishanensis]|uniref:MBL fold metallo-hydrolase RNA specificity domain-containing protein n=1 Tax=Flagellimonas meishanensis TaxID=2873264 RepID=UPI001CA6FA02|nr:MBL fold metallo-hydrolase [[Muricauda] meishanensis]